MNNFLQFSIVVAAFDGKDERIFRHDLVDLRRGDFLVRRDRTRAEHLVCPALHIQFGETLHPEELGHLASVFTAFVFKANADAQILFGGKNLNLRRRMHCTAIKITVAPAATMYIPPPAAMPTPAVAHTPAAVVRP